MNAHRSGQRACKQQHYLQKAFVESAANPQQKEAFIKAICARALWFNGFEDESKQKIKALFADVPTGRYVNRAVYLLSNGTQTEALPGEIPSQYTSLIIRPRYRQWYPDWGNEATGGRFTQEEQHQRQYVAQVGGSQPVVI